MSEPSSASEVGVVTHRARRISGRQDGEVSDTLAVESPLQICITGWSSGSWQRKSVAVTMRTPGDDAALAVGFLFTEGVIATHESVLSVDARENHVDVEIEEDIELTSRQLERHSFVSSSCGVCGKRSIAAVTVIQRFPVEPPSQPVSPEVLHALPEKLRRAQPVFACTGGIHAAGLFDRLGALRDAREDVGRHNALDKLIGAQVLAGNVPLYDSILLVSGRASFELVQKAALAGIAVVAAVGAPSSLAVQLADDRGITLIGFVRDGRCNIYSHPARVGKQK